MQAFRKLLCDLLLECKARPSHALPAFAAAADAWPGGLPPAGPSDAARLWSAAADTAGRDHSSCGVALMHSLASRVCACHSASVRYGLSRQRTQTPPSLVMHVGNGALFGLMLFPEVVGLAHALYIIWYIYHDGML